MLEQLRELAVLVDGDVACGVCGWAVREIERLQAIVDKLPKTADGVPMTPYADYYFPGSVDEIGFYTISNGHSGGLWYAFDLYSTREAAEAASEATNAN
ncbi:MAG: hypothetical protein GY807_24790 [Gammaproteobacteria bacterium]|nr:hypothetical protein [Gammaproteobacteria bacterium]